MPLTSAQRSALEAKAKEAGVDSAKLIAEAKAMLGAGESAQSADTNPASASASGEKPNLYMYHLPFVTVNEVRTIWLDLPEIDGGDEYAGVWAAKQGASTKPDPGAQ